MKKFPVLDELMRCPDVVRRVLCAVAVSWGLGCADSPNAPPPPPAAPKAELVTISVSPDSTSVAVFGTRLFLAVGRDASGKVVTLSPTWAVTGGGGSINSSGIFTAGSVMGTFVNTIEATSGKITGRATVIVTPGAPDRILITPSAVMLPTNGTQQFTAIVQDSHGNIVPITPTWKVMKDAGTITSSGLFTASATPGAFMWAVEAAAGDAISNGVTIGVTDRSAGLEFEAVTAGGQHTCGLANDGAAYCWGDNTHGALGNSVASTTPTPAAVSLARPFLMLSAGGTHTCGTTPTPWIDNYVTFCWGGNASGQLGDGTSLDSTVPHPLDSGYIDGAIISAGLNHTCMLDLWAWTGGRCWGANESGQLGDGTATGRTSPAELTMPGAAHFEIVAAGGAHTCGEASGYLYPTFSWYCWGANDHGQLGDGTTTNRSRGVIVGGGMSFVEGGVSAGANHTCGVAAGGAAYCWGLNNDGQLGDGTTIERLSPTRVAGGIQFVAVSSAESHTCGLTASGAAYCWGGNTRGQLGDGTTTNKLSPVPVVGGLTFAVPRFPRFGNSGTLSAGAGHTCGVTSTHVIYCWGANDRGELGNGTMHDSSVPVKVEGQR